MVDAKFQKPALRVAHELAQLKNAAPVSKAMAALNRGGLPPASPRGGLLPTVRIGVCFRTDSSGSAHADHDMKGLLAVNDLQPGPGCVVTCVALPRGAFGAATPPRDAHCGLSELDGIDLLYVPGAPAAPVSQTATSHHPTKAKEEREFNRKTDPGDVRPTSKTKGDAYDKAKREFIEFASRAPYEARLINLARIRGIPVLAICAGSWRLLESYGGKVRTLPLAERTKHKAASTKASDVWALEHGVATRPTTMVGGKGEKLGNVNSTHWAVACIRYNAKRKDFGLAPIDPAQADPDQLLEIAAFGDDPVSTTVEAFETRYGAPQIGIQWHPETYLPGMPGANQGSPEGRSHAKSLFLFIVGAALTAQRRRVGIAKELDREVRAFSALRDAVRAAQRGHFEIAGNFMKEAMSVLPRTLWSGRMEAASEAIRLIAEADDLTKSGQPVAAGNLYRDVLTLLRQAGLRA